jgi:hypothetical protein
MNEVASRMKRSLLLALAFTAALTAAGAPARAQSSWTTPLADRQTAVKPPSLSLIPVPKAPVWLIDAGIKRDPRLAALIAKKSVYSALCNELMGVANAWAIYASWVDPARGPTGRERVVPGLTSVDANRLRTLAKDAAALSRHEPHVPDLDEAIRTLAAMVEPVPALINAADGYYERKDYSDDDFKLAHEYHAQLAAAIPPLLTARETVRRQIAVLAEDLDRKELDLIEAADGKRYTWHARALLSRTGKLSTFFALDIEAARREGLKAAILEYAAAVRAFDGYRASPRAQSGSGGYDASRLLASVREWRDGQRTIWSVVNDYNSLVANLQPAPDGQ